MSVPSNPKPLDVVAVGNALLDVLAPVDDTFLTEAGIERGIMQLIDDDRAEFLGSHMPERTEVSGGSAANTAAGVVACGGTAGFIGTVSNDASGETYGSDLRSAGVVYRTAPLTSGPPSGRSFIFVSPDGERSMNTNLGAALCLSPEHLDVSIVGDAKIVYVEGYLLDTPALASFVGDFAAQVHEAGAKFSLTLADPFCVERHRKRILDLLGHIDILFCNEDELRTLYEVDRIDEAIDSVVCDCDITAVTRGAQGSVVVSGDQRIVVAADPVEVVDTTGAGDLYAAGFLYGVAQGWDLQRCGQAGSASAAAIVGQMGARLKEVSMEELRRAAG